MKPPRSEFDASLSRLRWLGVAGVLLFAGTVGVWTTRTSLSGAVVSQGQFVIENNTRKVQHPTGGVVAQLLVRDGDHVAANQVLARLDDTTAQVSLQILTRQLKEYLARRGRLLAERDRKNAITVAPELAAQTQDSDIADLIRSEQALFTARRAARDGQKAQLEQRVAQLHNEIDGLKAQLTSRDEQIVLVGEELTAARELYAKNLVSLARKIALEREAVNIAGQRGQLIAALAQSEGKIAEIRLQIIQIEDTFREDVMKELREVQGKIAELEERRIAAEDQLRRIDIRASISGVIHQLAIHTIGGVVNPAEPIMLIVPDNEPLQIEARIGPEDIDQIHRGGSAHIKLHAFNRRNTPDLEGIVSFISADTSREQANAPASYTIRVSVPAEQLDRLDGKRITPGMTADVFVVTESRTPLEFLMKPLMEQFSKTFRER
jgi:HlyD family secretion protein